jgi:hypothetical protein
MPSQRSLSEDIPSGVLALCIQGMAPFVSMLVSSVLYIAGILVEIGCNGEHYGDIPFPVDNGIGE